MAATVGKNGLEPMIFDEYIQVSAPIATSRKMAQSEAAMMKNLMNSYDLDLDSDISGFAGSEYNDLSPTSNSNHPSVPRYFDTNSNDNNNTIVDSSIYVDVAPIAESSFSKARNFPSDGWYI